MAIRCGSQVRRDSPLEESGFELMVPPRTGRKWEGAGTHQHHLGRASELKVPLSLSFLISLRTRGIRSSIPSLQRRVCKPSVPLVRGSRAHRHDCGAAEVSPSSRPTRMTLRRAAQPHAGGPQTPILAGLAWGGTRRPVRSEGPARAVSVAGLIMPPAPRSAASDRTAG
jgi:hypothetical protein